ncbi:MAG: prepilin-type N-terminal cleavage/methylation domain-containing protein, partial [Dokdonella sp.]
MQPNLPRHHRGFTLIEMIAAFVIFAIAVGALMQILTLSMNNARFSRDETRAALWAQSLLDTVGIGERVEAGSSSGEFDRDYRWQMQIDQ